MSKKKGVSGGNLIKKESSDASRNQDTFQIHPPEPPSPAWSESDSSKSEEPPKLDIPRDGKRDSRKGRPKDN